MPAMIPNALHITRGDTQALNMYGPDFPFAYDQYLNHPAGLGCIPHQHYGTEVAIIGGGLAGLVAAYELMKLGLKPVIYEAERLGGRLRSQAFSGYPEIIAELGAMRFPLSAKTFFHYVHKCGLSTKPFPNPLSAATSSTVIDLKGQTYYAKTLADLPPIFRAVAQAWDEALRQHAQFAAMQAALRDRDVATIKKLWNELIQRFDDQTFYGFLCQTDQFRSFRHREVFGQVGFGTGGWDTDFPNSILEILRVVYTGADDDHQTLIGGCQALPQALWARVPKRLTHWPAGTSLASLHQGEPYSAVVKINRTEPGHFTITDSCGRIRTFSAALLATQSWLLLSKIKTDERLFPSAIWTAIERTHYMQAAKTFALVDRPFWHQQNPLSGHDVMSMTLTDRMPRATYLLDNGPDQPAVICLSYTWNDDALKWLPLSLEERVDVMLQSLAEIYPNVDIDKRMIATPITISWEREPYFMGAFKANLPGHYRYQRRLFCHFMQRHIARGYQGFFLAGDDISWTAGWAEGAVQTALNAVWGMMRHFGGGTDPDNPGPGDQFAQLEPLYLPE